MKKALKQELEEGYNKVERGSRRSGRRNGKQGRLEWQGEANAASVRVTGGSRLHLRLPGNYRLDDQWRGDDNETINFTFTTRPVPPSPEASTHSEKTEKSAATSPQILVCVLICVFFCLFFLLSLSLTGFLPTRAFPSQTSYSVSDSDMGFTKEQLREAGRLGP